MAATGPAKVRHAVHQILQGSQFGKFIPFTRLKCAPRTPSMTVELIQQIGSLPEAPRRITEPPTRAGKRKVRPKISPDESVGLRCTLPDNIMCSHHVGWCLPMDTLFLDLAGNNKLKIRGTGGEKLTERSYFYHIDPTTARFILKLLREVVFSTGLALPHDDCRNRKLCFTRSFGRMVE